MCLGGIIMGRLIPTEACFSVLPRLKNMTPSRPIVSTGNAGFDSIFNGRLPGNRLYLLENTSGVQFLLDVEPREPVLNITLSETGEELQRSCSLAWLVAFRVGEPLVEFEFGLYGGPELHGAEFPFMGERKRAN
jgi:hypothetical protein